MSSGSIRTRSDRVAALRLPPGRFARTLETLRRRDVLLRLGLCLLAAIVMWLGTGAWAPPFAFRSGYIPPRDIVARIEFGRPDPDRTEALRKQKRSEMRCLYANNPQPLVQLQQALKDKAFLLASVAGFEVVEADKDKLAVWREFLPEASRSEMGDEKASFDTLRSALAADEKLAEFQAAVKRALSRFERDGLLENLTHPVEDGSHESILVHLDSTEDLNAPDATLVVAVKDVRIAETADTLARQLRDEFTSAKLPAENVETVAKLVFLWLRPRLPTTLTYNQPATRKAAADLLGRIEPVLTRYYPGQSTLARAGHPLTAAQCNLLHHEYLEMLQHATTWQKLAYASADFGMFLALYVLCGCYLYYHHRPLLMDLRRLGTLLGVAVLTVVVSRFAARDEWQAEIVPLTMFGMTAAIAYQRELSLLFSAAVTLVVTLSLGHGLTEFVIVVAAVAASILCLGRIRSRTKLIYVGIAAGATVVLTTLGVGTLTGEAFGMTPKTPSFGDAAAETSFVANLAMGAGRFGFFSLVSGILMTGLLPFIEKLFDVQTDISLLELGDAAHPLLQELARRAPGTYNHSINVASLSEAAAEAIGANGLLVRVGSYFHDIGKMFKPNYFIENQGLEGNRHDSLLPAMSTLVIIAHVKDGADLARQHRLPRSINDFIEQHHGTTLVEYFYNQATKLSEDDPDFGEVDESSFRYPGPKPQTREAGVLMLADAVEGASRTLVDPTPARIENLVHDILMRRLLDGQFEECSLTLRELHTIEDSLVKSLTAVYHGRVKYPERQSSAS